MAMIRSKLSPQARKAVMLQDDGQPIRAMVELAPGKSPEQLDVVKPARGFRLLSWNARSRVMNIEVIPSLLEGLSRDDAVHYIQVGGRMRRSAPRRDEGSRGA